MKVLLTALVILASGCGGSAVAPLLTPSGLVGTYQLRMFNGASVPGGGITSGSITLNSDSTYTLAINPWPLDYYDCTVPAGTSGSCTIADTGVPNPYLVGAQAGTWRDEGPERGADGNVVPNGHENLSLQPPARNSPRWYGSTGNGGIGFAGNGYPGLFFSR
jgi:hypothetical protein